MKGRRGVKNICKIIISKPSDYNKMLWYLSQSDRSFVNIGNILGSMTPQGSYDLFFNIRAAKL